MLLENDSSTILIIQVVLVSSISASLKASTNIDCSISAATPFVCLCDAVGTQVVFDEVEFERLVNKAYQEGASLKDGYAPFW